MAAPLTRVLMGPQNPVRNLGDAVREAALPEGPLAVVSAGWQEAEGDVDEVALLLGRDLEDLALYRRAEALLRDDQSLADASRWRQDRLLEQQRLYRQRLRQLSIAARQTLAAEGDAEAVAAEQRHAIAQLRALDRHHLHRCETVWRQFHESLVPDSLARIDRQAAEVAAILGRTAGVVITGGNVAVLINRLRLFGVAPMLATTHIVAWSAGAMALSDRIVLFHDRSPQGRRDAEILGAGAGLLPGYVFLPDAKRRLRTGNRRRLALICRRFSPDVCVTLNNGAMLHIDDGIVRTVSGVHHVNRNGRLAGLRAA